SNCAPVAVVKKCAVGEILDPDTNVCVKPPPVYNCSCLSIGGGAGIPSCTDEQTGQSVQPFTIGLSDSDICEAPAPYNVDVGGSATCGCQQEGDEFVPVCKAYNNNTAPVPDDFFCQTPSPDEVVCSCFNGQAESCSKNGKPASIPPNYNCSFKGGFHCEVSNSGAAQCVYSEYGEKYGADSTCNNECSS